MKSIGRFIAISSEVYSGSMTAGEDPTRKSTLYRNCRWGLLWQQPVYMEFTQCVETNIFNEASLPHGPTPYNPREDPEQTS